MARAKLIKRDIAIKVAEIVEEPAKRGKKRKQEIEHILTPKKIKTIDITSPNIENGILLAAGTGDIGQLGLGPNVEEKSRPCTVSDISNVLTIAAGGLHSVCITKDGKMYTWGCNDEGALGRETKSEDDNFSVGVVNLGATAVQICAGDCHTAALTNDGRVFVWGSFRDNSGPLGLLEKGIIQKTPFQILKGAKIVKISSGHNHIVMLSHDGVVYTIGCGECGQLGRIAEFFASRESRNRNSTKNLLNPLPIKVYKGRRKMVKFSNIWAGGYVTFVKDEDGGNIYGFGLNNFCQLGEVDTNMKFQPYLLKAFKNKDWVSISPGQHHSIALDSEGVAYVMGRNEYGRLGMGENSGDAKIPTPIPSLNGKKVTHVAAGECVSFVVLESGEACGFGMGTNNQLCQGNEDDLWQPTPLTGKQLNEKKVVSVEAGGQHTLILAVPKS